MTNWASKLRTELSWRAKDYAKAGGIACYESLGASPTTMFPAGSSVGTHGNFISDSYRAVIANGSWSQRLGKVQTGGRGRDGPFLASKERLIVDPISLVWLATGGDVGRQRHLTSLGNGLVQDRAIKGK